MHTTRVYTQTTRVLWVKKIDSGALLHRAHDKSHQELCTYVCVYTYARLLLLFSREMLARIMRRSFRNGASSLLIPLFAGPRVVRACGAVRPPGERIAISLRRGVYI